MSGDCSPQSEGRTDFNDNNNNIATSKQENEMRDTARARYRHLGMRRKCNHEKPFRKDEMFS